MTEKIVEKMLSNRKLYNQYFLERPESISDLLPYNEFLPEDQIFILKDGSFGACFLIDLIPHEPLVEKEIIKVIQSTKSWFNLPENFVLQIYFDSSFYSPLDPALQSLDKTYPNAHTVSKKLFEEKCLQIKNALKPIKRQLIVSMRYFHSKKSQKHIEKELAQFKDNLYTFMHYLKNFKDNSKLNIKQMNDSQLCTLLRRFFNPITFYLRSFIPIQHHIPLSDQLIYTSCKLDFDGICREGIKTRTITLKTSPAYSYPASMAQFVQLDFPFRLSINISFPNEGKVKKFLTTKEFFLENAMSAKARIQKEEILSIGEALAREDRCLAMTFTVIIEGENEDELNEKARKISHIFHHELECEVIEEKDIGLGLCLNTLPLNYVPDADYSTRRAIRILKSDIANFIPLFDSFRGFVSPLAVYLSRENNLVHFSLLENETSNHTVVLADTGSGKSAFVIDCLVAAKRLSPEPIIFVIDKKSSYGMLAQYFDGDITIFDRNRKIPFSPFRGEYNEEKIAFLTKIMAMAISLTSPAFQLESEHYSAITKALKNAYVKKYQRHGLKYIEGDFIKSNSDEQVVIDMNDFVVELGSLEDQTGIQSLISKLKPFYGDGMYAPFFTQGQTENKNNEKLFFIYDLDALDGDPILQTLMTMSVIEEIRCILSLPSNKGRTGFLVMEEFAMLGRNNSAFRDFAIDFAETMRKRGCWLITLTPRPQNYFDLEVGKAFWGVADNFIFLQMSSDNVDYIAQKSSLLDQANKEIIRSLRTKKNQYADVFYMNKSKTIQGAFRFRQTLYDRWMSPTNATDSLLAINALEKYPNKWQALEYLVEQTRRSQ